MLVDRLLDLPFESIAVLDISETALSKARSRLGERPVGSSGVADITEVDHLGTFDVWHDRAVFHFLTDTADRGGMSSWPVGLLGGGHLIIATFADDGPKRCSDLDVCRCNAGTMGPSWARVSRWSGRPASARTP